MVACPFIQTHTWKHFKNYCNPDDSIPVMYCNGETKSYFLLKYMEHNLFSVTDNNYHITSKVRHQILRHVENNPNSKWNNPWTVPRKHWMQLRSHLLLPRTGASSMPPTSNTVCSSLKTGNDACRGGWMCFYYTKAYF